MPARGSSGVAHRSARSRCAADHRDPRGVWHRTADEWLRSGRSMRVWRSASRSSSSCRDFCCSARGCEQPRPGPATVVEPLCISSRAAHRAGLSSSSVLVAYALYQFRDAGPNPGHTWMGLLEHLTLTQIYEPVYFFVMHQGLTQTWSLAVEFAFYAALPLMAALLLTVLCKGVWRPGLLLAGLAGLATITPVWLWLQSLDRLVTQLGRHVAACAHLLYFVGGMALAVLQVVGARVRASHRRSARGGQLSDRVHADRRGRQHRRSPLWQTLVKVALYATVACAVVAPLVLGGSNGFAATAECSSDRLARGDFLRDLPAARDRDGDRDGVGVALAGLHRLVAGRLRGHPGDDDSAGLAVASVDTAELDYFWPSDRWAYGSLSAPTDSGIG